MQNLPNVQLPISTETERSTYTNVQFIAHRLIKLKAGTTKDTCKRQEWLCQAVSSAVDILFQGSRNMELEFLSVQA